MKFKGTIVITDPCYIMRKEDGDHKDDWGKCEYGDNMEALGIATYITKDTEYGDWSCTTLEEGTNKHLGHFCADAGLVSVFLLEEVLKYNPEYKPFPLGATLIEDFEGDIEITHRNYTYEDEDGEEDIHEVSVIGKGSVNFFTTQTGF